MTDGQEILKQLRELQIQQTRFESHLTSEFGNYTRQLEEIWKDLRDKEARLREYGSWKNNMEGRIFVTGVFAGFIFGILAGIAVWFFTTKK